MPKMLFVFNPNSGKARIKYVLLDIIKILSRGGYDLTVYPTKAPRDGYKYVVSNGAAYDVIACSGGDGTLNETVDALLTMEPQDRPPIGYIPSGSTNDFANTLGIPKSMKDAARCIVKGTPHPCDVGDFNGRTFNYVAAFGAFTDVPYATPQDMKNVLGHQAYLIEAMKRVTDIRPIPLTIHVNGNIIRDEFIYGMISNTTSVGGMKNLIGTGVGLNDGLFELTFIRKPKNPIDLQQLLNGFMTQSMQDKTQVLSCKCSRVEIESPQEVEWVLDGEYGGKHTKMVIEVKRSAVRLITTQDI